MTPSNQKQPGKQQFGMIGPNMRSRRFDAIGWVQCDRWLAGNCRQPLYSLSSAWRALVDAGLTPRDGTCVGRAIRIPATCALGLGQGGQNLGRIGWHGAISC